MPYVAPFSFPFKAPSSSPSSTTTTTNTTTTTAPTSNPPTTSSPINSLLPSAPHVFSTTRPNKVSSPTSASAHSTPSHVSQPSAASANLTLTTTPPSTSTRIKPKCSQSSLTANSNKPRPSAYSPSSKPSSLSTKFLTKQPRGFPQRSPPLSPSYTISPGSPASSNEGSAFSSASSSASSSTSSSSVSLDNDPSFYSKLAELEKAVHAMAPLKHSNLVSAASVASAQQANSANITNSASTTALSTLVLTTPTARSTTGLSSLALESSSSSSSENDLKSSPNIIKKKSGETVKSSLKLPSLVRHSSMPATSKAVHFDVNLERVRHFLHSEKPNAVSASSSPTEERPKFHWGTDSESSSDSESEEEEDPRLGFQRYLDRTEWQISLPNFRTLQPEEVGDRMLFVESIFLSSDKNTLLGHIAVKNIAFEKHVSIKYSIDHWKTVTELAAEYNDDVRRRRRLQGFDRFTFAINMGDFPQHAISTKSIFFCVRYSTGNDEFWDNNNGSNYQVDFTRVTKIKSGPVSRPSSTVRLPARHHRRSKSSDVISTPANMFSFGTTKPLNSDKDFGFDIAPHMNSSVDEEFFSRPKFRVGSPTKQNKKNQFTSRYDFGDSFKSPTKPSPFNTTSSLPHTTRAQLASDPKLALNAKSYQELIDSYCFFQGPGASKPGKAKPVKPESPAAAGPALLDKAPELSHEWNKGFGVSV